MDDFKFACGLIAICLSVFLTAMLCILVNSYIDDSFYQPRCSTFCAPDKGLYINSNCKCKED
jgi:hypothetical protein